MYKFQNKLGAELSLPDNLTIADLTRMGITLTLVPEAAAPSKNPRDFDEVK